MCADNFSTVKIAKRPYMFWRKSLFTLLTVSSLSYNSAHFFSFFLTFMVMLIVDVLKPVSVIKICYYRQPLTILFPFKCPTNRIVVRETKRPLGCRKS